MQIQLMLLQNKAFQSTLVILAGLLTLGTMTVGTAPAAQACDQALAQLSNSPSPNSDVNVRLGMGEAELVQYLGQPQRRGREPVRCPTNRIHLTYAKSTIVLKPKQEADLAQQPSNSAALPQPKNTDKNLVVIGFVSADPAVVIEGGIHVGISAEEAQERMARMCDRNSLETSTYQGKTSLSCTFGGDPVKIRIQNQQVKTITVGDIYNRSDNAQP